MKKRFNLLKKVGAVVLSASIALGLSMGMPMETKAASKTVLLTKTVSNDVTDGVSTFAYRTESKYDSSGLETAYIYKSDDTTTKNTYTYDKKDRVKKVKRYYNGELSGIIKYTYKGNTTTCKEFYSDGSLEQTTVTETTTKKSVQTVYDSSGEVTYVYTYKKDSDGNITSGTCKEGDGTLYSKEKYTYDKKGRITKFIYNTYSDGSVAYGYKYTYTYKGKKQNIKCYSSESGGDYTIFMQETYIIDDYQYVPVKDIYYTDGEVSTTYTYESTYYTSGAKKGYEKTRKTYTDGTQTGEMTFTYKVI